MSAMHCTDRETGSAERQGWALPRWRRITAGGPLSAPGRTLPGMGIMERGEEQPQFGYGRGERPLSSVVDRDAEAIREVLRGAGRPEFSDSEDGFVVESGDEGSSFLVACTFDEWTDAEQELQWYRMALTDARMRVEPDPEDRKTVVVWMPQTA